MKKLGISTWTHDGFILKSVNPKLFTVEKKGKVKSFKRLKDAKSYVLASSLNHENFHSGDKN